MRQTIGLFLLAAILLAGSCSKQNSIVDVPGVKVKTRTSHLTGGGTDSFFYNVDGTLQTLLNYGGHRYTYHYSSTSVVESQYNASGLLTASTIYYLGSDGLVDSERTGIGNPPLYSSVKFYYNADHLTSSTREYDNGGALAAITTFTYSGGNAIRRLRTDATGTTLDSTDLSYNTTMTNSIDGNHSGQPYLNALSANMPSHQSATTAGVTTTRDWTYTLDSHGYISTIISTNGSGGVVSSFSYSYY